MSDGEEHEFLGAGIGKWGSDSWNTRIDLGELSSEERVLTSVEAAFPCLQLAGLLILSIFILLLRRSRKEVLTPMPLIATLAAMFSLVV